MRILENGFEDATAVLAFPEKYRKRLRTTNSVERLNEKIRKRERRSWECFCTERPHK
ncbi:hypothetical protein GCM10010965_26520 [Caldalkalibacillus thermarum]|nr:hypothetical protein GCM10010965_26520 [Caldalkalibacillus thermarum]